MVGRRNQKKGRNNKLTKQIYANLLKITMRTDNYIYNNEPMTINEAKLMQNELRTYERITKNDVRFLQIIDKQTRLLQGIIVEEENISKSTVYDNINVLDNILNGDEIEKESNALCAPNASMTLSGRDLDTRSVDCMSTNIGSNTSVKSPLQNTNIEKIHIPIIEKTKISNSEYRISTSNTTFGLTESSMISTSDVLVKTPSLSDNNQTVYHDTPETSNLVSQSECLVPQNICENAHNKNIYKQINSKRRKIGNDYNWIENMKYVRIVEHDEFDIKLSNLGKLWDNFQLPPNWDESEFSLE